MNDSLRLILILGVALAAGCSKKETPVDPEPPPRKPTIWVKNESRVPLKIVADDTTIATFDGWDWTGTARITHDDRKGIDGKIESSTVITVDQEPKKLQALASHPDGWNDSLATINGLSIVVKKPESWKTKRLMVDNRRGKAVEIALGDMKHSARADWKGNLFYYRPSSPASAVVRIDGKEVGTLWPKDKPEPDWETSNFFVDVTGGRSYRYREVYYSTLGMIDAARASLLGIKPVSGELNAAYVHTVPFGFTFFLEPAPMEISIKESSAVFEKRTELVDR